MKKRLLSILAVMAMMLTLVTVLGISVSAAPTHTHAWTYSADGNTMYADCGAAGHTGTNPEVLMIYAPTVTKYDGTSHAATLSGSGSVGDYSPDIYYVGTETTSYSASLTPPTNAGSYKAYFTVEGQTAYVTYSITKRNVTLTSEGGSKLYDGTPLSKATVTVTGDGFVSGEGMTYSATGSQTVAGKSKNTISYTLDAGTNPKNYAITKSEGTLEVTAIVTPITITAESASRMYDGTALTAGYTYTSGVLLDGDVLNVTVSGEQTHFGSTANTVTSYSVMRGSLDVTDSYTFEDSVDGTLSITKRDVTLTSAADSKTYDGTPLTNGNVTVTGSGFVTGEGATYNVTGSQTVAGASKNTFSYNLNAGTSADDYSITAKEGTLTVYANNTAITITVDDQQKLYDGTANINTTAYTVTGTFCPGDSISVNLSTVAVNAGSGTVYATYAIYNAGGTDVTDSYNNVTVENGELTINKRAVTITSDSATKAYDGTPLTKNSTVISAGDGFVGSEGYTANVTGSQTVAGTSDNTFTYTLNQNTYAGNYDITTVYGTLTVSKLTTPVTITADSDNKMYDGTPLTDSGYTYTGTLAAGDYLSVTVTGSVTHVEDSPAVNRVTAYKIYNAAGTDVTDSYTVDLLDGVLTVGECHVTMTSATDTKTYDGTPLTNHSITVTGDGFAAGEGATYSVTGSQTSVGTSKNTFTYTLYANTKASDYIITTEEGDLTVDGLSATFTVYDKSVLYDGNSVFTLTSTDYSVTGLAAGHYVDSVTVSLSSADANVYTAYTVTAVIKNASGTDVTAGYGITVYANDFTVSKREVTLATGDATKAYDGTPLTNATVTVTGDGFAAGEDISYTVTGSQTLVGSCANTLSYTLTGGALSKNYDITVDAGTLTVNPTSTAITITAKSATKMYDGTALSDSGYTSTGMLAAGDVLTATVVGEITHFGTANNVVTGYKIMHGSTEVTSYYSNVQTEDGTLSITKRDVKLTSASDSKTYDGTPLTNDTVTVTGTGFVTGEGATYNVTGAQTVSGASKNTYSYDLNAGTSADDYSITAKEGTLTVYTNGTSVTITVDDQQKLYDGTTDIDTTAYTVTGTLCPGDSISVNLSTDAVNAGFGTVYATYTIYNAGGTDVTDSYNNVTVENGELTINKRAVTITSDSASKEYDGTPLTKNSTVISAGDGFVSGEGYSANVTGSQTGIGTSANTFTYTLNQNTHAGNYDITTVEGTLSVTGRELVISIDDMNVEYNGKSEIVLSESDCTILGLATGDSIESIVLKLSSANVNIYMDGTVESVTIKNAEGEDVTAYYSVIVTVGTITVTPREIALTLNATKTKEYDGTPLTCDMTDVQITSGSFADGESIRFIFSSQTAVGSCDTEFAIDPQDTTADNYVVTIDCSGILTVTKRQVTVQANAQTKGYGEADPELTVTVYNALESEPIVYTVTREAGEALGTYAITVSGNAQQGNYVITYSNATFTITKANVIITVAPLGKILAYDAESHELVSVGFAMGGVFQYKVGRNGTYSIERPTASEIGEYTIYYRVLADKNHVDSPEYTLGTSILDMTAPEGEIVIEDNSYETYLKYITFGKSFKDSYPVTINATDFGTGVASIEYLVSETALDLDALSATVGWTAYTETFALASVDKCVVYARITDGAGNVTYISSDGMTFEAHIPTISDIDPDAVYYTTQKFTPDDLANVAKVTVNGMEVTAYLLAGNVDCIYTIVVTDKSGKETTYTVTMKTIASISEPIKDLTVANVKSSDRDSILAVRAKLVSVDTVNATKAEKDELAAAIKNCDDLLAKIKEVADNIAKVKQAFEGKTVGNITREAAAALEPAEKILEALLASDNLTPAERKELEALKVNVAELKKRIEELEKALHTENIEAVKDVTIDNCKLDDLDHVKGAIEDLEKVLKEYPGNLTATEKKEIEDRIEELKAIKLSIEKSLEVKELIDQDGADPEDIVEKYDALTEHEKEMLGEDFADKVDDLRDELYRKSHNPKIVEGAGQTVDISKENVTATFKSEAPFDEFRSVKVDGTEVDAKYYDAKSAPTVITFKTEYLKTLAEGEHTLDVVSEYGTASCTFTVTGASASNGYIVWVIVGIVVLLLIAVIVILIVSRKKKQTPEN